MGFGRVIAKRLAFGAVTAWGILTVVFLLFTVSRNWVLEGVVGSLRLDGASESELDFARQEYLAGRGLDRPLFVQYTDWMGSMATLDWGRSMATGDAVFPMVWEATLRTAAYVVPAIVIAIVIGVLVGLYAALRPKGRLANGGRATAYLLFAVPTFWIGGILFSYAKFGDLVASPALFGHVLPIALTATALVGGYASYTRAHALEYTTAEFVTLVEAKGATRRRIATHVLRNAAIPVFSMLFTEALGLLVLVMLVIETLFGIDGFGLLLLGAINQRDLPVLLGATIVIIGVGVVGNIVQDLSYGALDPRVDTGTR